MPPPPRPVMSSKQKKQWQKERRDFAREYKRMRREDTRSQKLAKVPGRMKELH